MLPSSSYPQAEQRQAHVLKGTANYSGILGESEIIVSGQ